MDDLQGEVENFVSQLGFDQLNSKEIDDDDYTNSKEIDDDDYTPKEKPKKAPRKSKDGAPKEKPNKAPRQTVGEELEDRPKKAPRKGKQRKESPAAGDGSAAGDGAVQRSGKRGRSGRQAPESAVQVPEVSSSVAAAETAAAHTPAEKKWYQLSVTDRETGPVQPSVAAQLLQEATSALNHAVKAFKADGAGQTAGQWSWTQTVLTSGTVSDKLSARQALLASRPQLGLHLLEDTVRMVAARGKGHSMQAMHMLANAFGKQLLPPDRKLKGFRQQPLGALQDIAVSDPAVRKRQLVLWLFEDRLKALYKEFVGRVREMAHDTLEKTRKHGVNTLAQLLVAHPELEQTLLEVLVNKLGDEKKTVACLAVRRLSSLLRSHPAMRTVVVKEVERLLFRQNVGKRVQFYGICFLSQVQFSDEGDEPLAQRIVRIYVGFFRACVKLAELDARLMRALLTGLSGCVGRARLLQDQLQQYVHPLHHIAQLANFGVATQALLLMFRLTTAGGQSEPTDRYYSTLYKKLVHPGLATSQKVADFLNLVYRSVRVDPCEPRARAFIKRLLQCCLHQTAALACSVLLLVSELFRRRPALARLSGQQAASTWTGDQDSDGEEAPRDVPLPEDAEQAQQAEQAGDAAPVPGWRFVGAAHGPGRRRYDPLYREPRWCRAELTALHELAPLARHLHPTLALFAGQLTAGRPTTYAGNPLHDFQLMHFLNRFCYRNPKKTGAGAAVEAARRLPVTAPGYARLSASQVPHDERFFHRYFSWRVDHGLAPARPGPRLTDASGDVTDEAFDEFLDGFFGKRAGGDGVDFLSEMADGAEERLQADGDAGSDEDGMDLDADGQSDDDDLADMEDSLGEDSEDEDGFPAKRFKSLPLAGKSKVSKSGDVSDLFASADEFSELLEEGAESSPSAAAAKTSRHQLQWEEEGTGKRRRPAARADRRTHRHNGRTGAKGGAKQKKKKN